LHPAEFSEICGAKDLSGFMRLSDLLNGEVRCKKPLRLIFALRILCKKPLRSIFALRIYGHDFLTANER